MARVMAVAFERHGRLYYLDPGDHVIAVGDTVLYPTDHGDEVAQCVLAPREVEWDALPLPVCGGLAGEDDVARDEAHRFKRAEVRAIAEALIERHELPMDVVAVDYLDEGIEGDRMCVVYFKAPHRVDFRLLLGDLARALQSRIDLRQIGARDVAALCGGIGSCGRELCCAAMRPAAAPVPVRMARTQEVPSNPLQSAGACGRLKCCIAYEHDAYVDFLARAPEQGSVVRTPKGEGVVSGQSMPADAVFVRTAEGVQICRLADATVVHGPRPTPPGGPRGGSGTSPGRPTGPTPRTPVEPSTPVPPPGKAARSGKTDKPAKPARPERGSVPKPRKPHRPAADGQPGLIPGFLRRDKGPKDPASE
jgi:cell fate regulator YaaT (PSP1 superfamily)